MNKLEPLTYATHTTWTKSYRDDYVYMWLGRVQGVHKAKALIKKLKSINNGKQSNS